MWYLGAKYALLIVQCGAGLVKPCTHLILLGCLAEAVQKLFDQSVSQLSAFLRRGKISETQGSHALSQVTREVTSDSREVGIAQNSPEVDALEDFEQETIE